MNERKTAKHERTKTYFRKTFYCSDHMTYIIDCANLITAEMILSLRGLGANAWQLIHPTVFALVSQR